MMWKRAFPAATALLAGALVLSACGAGGGGSGARASDTIKIGFLGDLTGESSGLVTGPRNGAKMVIEAYNAKNPPKKIELLEYDSQGTPDQAVPLATKAVQDGIVAMIGPAFSGESKAADPVLEQAKIPNISPVATNPGLAENGWKYFHRDIASDAEQGPAIAQFLVSSTHPRRAYVVNDDQEYSVGLADAVEKDLTAQGLTVGRDQFAQSASDYSSSIAKIKAANPEVIFFGGYYSQGGRLLKQIRDAGVKALFAAGDGSLDVGLINGAGQGAAEGAIVGCPCAVPSRASAQGDLKTFFDAYSAKYSADPGVYATEGYDAATAFVKAIEAGNTTSESINNYLATISYQGVAKAIKFRPNGNVESTAIFIHRVHGGKFDLLGNSKDAKLG
jgi:branched-chain amino acid transport system substrate-binding protein